MLLPTSFRPPPHGSTEATGDASSQERKLVELTPVTAAVVYLLIGLFSGISTGMFGIGGGAIRTPLLNIFGLSLRNAFGVNLFIIPFSTLIGAINHRKDIDWVFVKPVVAGGIVGSIAGALLVGLFSNLTLAFLFFALAVLTSAGVFLDRLWPRLSQNLRLGPAEVGGITFLLNLATGMRGGSGGSVLPPLLKVLTGDIRRAIATSLFATIFTAVAGALVYWNRGDIDWIPALFAMAGSLVGAWFGSVVSIKTRSVWLEAGLSGTVMLFALATVYMAI